ncbi:TPA: imidazoleglycerol-phosphate dehydratase [Candidatus Bathyarchaeota archaeon]|nr:imidazoleglycerol-phosphate dehydratase [Candidatus Bathyarchaeota archaeon]
MVKPLVSIIIPNYNKAPYIRETLESFAFHAGFGFTVEAEEYEPLNDHHLVEDTAITLGEALLKALNTKAGIGRFGWAAIPMDEALILASLDLSGRGYFQSNLSFTHSRIGDLSAEMVNHFFQSLAISGKFTLHLAALRGVNDHHKAEAAFKAVGLALAQAVRRTGKEILSLKGVL